MNWFAVAFVGIAGIAVVGVDYASQSHKTGAGLGGLTPAAYMQTITGRFDDSTVQRAEAARLASARKTRAKEHLPAAPQGWVRRELTASDRDRLFPSQRANAELEKELMAELEASPLTRAVLSTEKTAATKRERDTIWVYEKGGDLILMSARWTPTQKAKRGILGLQQAAINMAAHNMSNSTATESFAWIRGVPFYKTAQGSDQAYRVFQGRMGPQIRLTVRADAADATIRAFMAAINYDGLNQMLDQPLAHIGNAVPDVELADQIALADFMKQARIEADRVTAQRLEADVQDRANGIANLLSAAPQDRQAAAVAPVVAAEAPTQPRLGGVQQQTQISPSAGTKELPRRLTLSGSNGCGAGRFCSVKN